MVVFDEASINAFLAVRDQYQLVVEAAPEEVPSEGMASWLETENRVLAFYVEQALAAGVPPDQLEQFRR